MAPSAVRSTCLMVSTAGRPTNGGAVLLNRVNGALYGRGVNQRTHRVMHQHEVIRLCHLRESRKRVGDRTLAMIATFDKRGPAD